jgi:bacterial surface protein 26-residue repeat
MKFFKATLIVLLISRLSTIAVGEDFACFSDVFKLSDAIWAIDGTGDGYTYTDTGGDYGPIESWCFDSSIQDFSFLFGARDSFNANIAAWNVSSVTNMNGMVSYHDACLYGCLTCLPS